MARRVCAFMRVASGGLLASVTLALAGCGSSGTLSHAELVSRADTACRETNANIARLSGPRDLKALASYATSTRTLTSQLEQSLSALTPPSADRAALNRYLASLRRGDTILAQLSTAAAGGDRAAVSSLGEELAGLHSGALAAAADLSSCALPPTPAAGEKA
jgi:hypothetical protein